MNPMRRTWFVVLVVPLVIGLAGLAVVAAIQLELPDPVATHWGTDGVDGVTSREVAPYLALLGVPLGWFTGGIIVVLGRRSGTMRRLGAGFGCGMAAFGTMIAVATLWAQRGLANATQATDPPDLEIALAVVAALVVGALGALAVPGSSVDDRTAHEPVPADAPRVALGAGETAVWSRQMWSSTGGPAILGGVVVLMIGLTIVTRMWLGLGLVTLLVLVVSLTVVGFRVSVSRRGLVARGLLGLPRFVVPLDEVAVAHATTTNPFAEFGGWGYRLSLDGKEGIVLRTGESIEVTRGDGTIFVVTVSDAERGAALLNTLADRQRTGALG